MVSVVLVTCSLVIVIVVELRLTVLNRSTIQIVSTADPTIISSALGRLGLVEKKSAWCWVVEGSTEFGM